MSRFPVINKESITSFLQRTNDRINDPTSQRRLVLIIVSIALLLDNMLYMVIVPIIPKYLRSINAFGERDWSLYNWTQYNTSLAVITNNKTETEITGRMVERILGFLPPPIDWGEGEDAAIGVLFASKAIVQLCFNPFTGALIDRIGYDVPMMIGLMVMFLSTSTFAFGEGYTILFIARSLQGLGSAFADTAGLAMIADRFTEENDRSTALGIALAFISFGSLVAPPFGGVLYQFAGKIVPFLMLACVSLVDGILLLFVMKPVRKLRSLVPKEDRPRGTPIWRLFIDKHIAIAAGALAMSNVSLAFVEPTISVWMQETMNASEWQMGFVWLPAFIPHILGVYMTVRLSRKYQKYQWLIALIGLTIEGVSCSIIPFAKVFPLLILPICLVCFGIALVDTSLLPTLAYLVDQRYVSVYGSVYAIADISYSIAYALGPIMAGQIVHSIGFTWLNMFIMIMNVAYAPVLLLLRRIYDYRSFDNEGDVLVDHDELDKKYMSYNMQNGDGGKPLPLSNYTANYASKQYSNIKEQDEAGYGDDIYQGLQ